jgi:predicted nucleotidyltransferase
MHDPDEGVRPDGTIVTGARRDRVPVAFEPIVVAALDDVRAVDRDVALYLYGSVATGRAQVGESDVDLLTIGLPAVAAAAMSRDLSSRFISVCRSVEISRANRDDFAGEYDEAYGNRVFLHHYCVKLSGKPRSDLSTNYPADSRAARGFNGDIGMRAQQWRHALNGGGDPTTVSYRLARKTLLAVASLVSVHDDTWTTDRIRAARRWAEIDPPTASDMAALVDWTRPSTTRVRSRHHVQRMLAGTITRIVEAFRTRIGLWPR